MQYLFRLQIGSTRNKSLLLKLDVYLYKRASLACAARLAKTFCSLEAPVPILINYKVDNISKYVCLLF